MKDVELYVWSRCGMLDGDGYETNYSVTDKDYDTIVALVKRYIKETCDEEVADEDYEELDIDSKEFTDEYFYTNAKNIYNKIYNSIEKEAITSIIESAKDWFEEDEEGCTIEEYVKNNFDFGFYFTEEFLESIID